jgi:hypothetical protein
VGNKTDIKCIRNDNETILRMGEGGKGGILLRYIISTFVNVIPAVQQ